MGDELSRAHAEALDAADPLASFRDRFVVADPHRIYLDGNSLGRLPSATRERLRRLTDEWGETLVSGWPEWIDAPQRAGDAVAEVLGAGPGEVICCDSVTVNLYKLAMAAHRTGSVATEDGAFPTDRYVLEGIAAERGCRFATVPSPQEAGDGDPLAGVPDDCGLLVLSHVDYRTGGLADLPRLTDAARERGIPLIWDLSHSAGVAPAGLAAAGAELAVGCTYKYLNAGPGAPGFLYVARRLQTELVSPIRGWFGQRDQFAMGPAYDPDPSIRRFMAGTPSVLGLAAVEEGARLTAEAGIAAIRLKSSAQTDYLVGLHDAWLDPLGFRLGSPRDPARRGSHVSLRHADAWRVNRALIERADVVPDFREPDTIRLGVAPLYTRFVDLWDAVDRLRRLVEAGEHRELGPERSRVT